MEKLGIKMQFQYLPILTVKKIQTHKEYFLHESVFCHIHPKCLSGWSHPPSFLQPEGPMDWYVVDKSYLFRISIISAGVTMKSLTG